MGRKFVGTVKIFVVVGYPGVDSGFDFVLWETVMTCTFFRRRFDFLSS